jgi:hypothetical protein
VPKSARTEIAPFVREFAEKLRADVGAEKVILFGSRARGDWLKESDYDFIVVSRGFDGIPFISRPVPLYAHWSGDGGIELLCYTPEEFERKRRQISIVAEAAREGIEL